MGYQLPKRLATSILIVLMSDSLLARYEGPDRVKRRPARVPLNLLLSSFTVAPALPPSYLPFAAIEAWTARRNA